MLATRSQRFIELVNTKQRLESEKESLKFFTTRKTALQEIVSALAGVSTSYQVMTNVGIPCPNLRETIESALTMVKIRLKHFLDNPNKALDGQEFVPFQRQLKSAVETLNKRLLDIWNAYIQQSLPHIQTETLVIFKKISSFQQDIEVMNQRLQLIGNASNHLPMTVNEVKKVTEEIKSVHAIWNRFGQGNVPGEVLEFLKLAGSPNGAPIRLWTSEVIQWLEEQGIKEHCTIRI
ncbi:hypothetical protein [Gorillibacterium sp. sgz5001074]|uniref:hypothetical protein n=1 Tax=Gorillibacterium sp. sgz5001074 TaxID=3446695 RepID=UPI003F678D7B